MTNQTALPLWVRLYEQYFDSRLYDHEAAAVTLRMELGADWSEDDMLKTYVWMTSADQRGKWPKKPNGKTLAIAYRTRIKAESATEHVPVGGIMDELRAEMDGYLRAGNHNDLWERIVGIAHGDLRRGGRRVWLSKEQLADLQDYARLRGWQKPNRQYGTPTTTGVSNESDGGHVERRDNERMARRAAELLKGRQDGGRDDAPGVRLPEAELAF